MRVWRRVQRLVRWRRFESDLAEELRFHREMAGPAFGSVALTLEDSRAVWRFAWLDSLAQDMRYALRGFRKSPGFALTVIGTLALGLGVLATSFSVFNGMVLRPYAVRDPYSLYTFIGWGPTRDRPSHSLFSWREFNEFRSHNPAFSDVLGYQNINVSVAGKDAFAQAVTGNYFHMLGGGICVGRPILEGDDGPGSEVAVASYAAWERLYGGDPGVVGTKVYLRGRPVDLVGVACPEFNGVSERRIDFWVSLALSISHDSVSNLFGPGEPWLLTVVGRLKPGMTQKAAEAALLAYGQPVMAALEDQRRANLRHGEVYRPEPTRYAPLRQSATVLPLDRDSIGTFLPAFAAFGLILLIACANVANMMLARGLARQREIGIRISLGAGRGRMIRQLLTESLLLALPAALAAFGVAHGTIRGALWLQLNVLHADWRWTAGLENATPDPRVLLFLLAAAGIATLVFGLMPAIQTSRFMGANRGEFASDRRPARLRGGLVVAQVAVCALLLILASVALRAERRIASQDLRIDARGIFTVTMKGSVADKKFRQPLVERLLALPATALLGVCTRAPGSVTPPTDVVTEKGKVAVPSTDVSPEYFGIYGLPVRGRNFSTAEAEAAAPEVIVSESAARRLWPNSDALGQTLHLKNGLLFFTSTSYRIVQSALVIGVARDSIYGLFVSSADPAPTRALLYFPMGLRSPSWAASLLVRTKGNPESARRTIERAVEDVGPDAASVSSMQESLDRYFYPFRAMASIAAFLGALALLLTVSGVFGVSSYAVTQRRKEFGIRIALGANTVRVTGMVLRQSALLSAVGAAVGALAALAVARVIAHSLTQIGLFDPGAYAAGVLVVIAAAVAAAWVPARRAVKVDPVVTLRCD